MLDLKEKDSYDEKTLDEYVLKVIKKFARDGFKSNSGCYVHVLDAFQELFIKDEDFFSHFPDKISEQCKLFAKKIYEKRPPHIHAKTDDLRDELYKVPEEDNDCYILSEEKRGIESNKLNLSCLPKSEDYLYIMHVARLLLMLTEYCQKLNILPSCIHQNFGANMGDWNILNKENIGSLLKIIIGEDTFSNLDDIKLADFELFEELWVPGAFGTVCLAHDKSNNLVALKKISHNKRSFLKELESVLFYKDNFNDHPNLIKILSVGIDEDIISDDLVLPILFYTMEVADDINSSLPFAMGYYGMTLANLISLIDKIKTCDLFIILEQLLNGVKFLHDHGAAHRDIKPDNILFVDGIPKLADVGLVSSHEATMSLAGTPGFLPQEHMEKVAYFESPDQRMDLYALGMTAYCAFTGFSPERYPEVPFELLKSSEERKMNKIILKACAKDPSERFQTADEFIAALKI